MATITSFATGFYDVGGTWVGGIVPIEGDKVIIASGHVVTIRDTRIAGNDTTTAFTITGTLKADRTANSSLTVKGDIQMSALTSATIDYGRLSTADPIPAGINATLILNYSASMANYKYGLFKGDSANVYFCGETKARNTVTSSSLAVSGTSVDVADITGWAVGDWVVFAETDGTISHHERKQIATLTPGAGTTGTITFTAVSYAHAIGCSVGNFSSNVTVKSYNTTNPAYVCFRVTSTGSNNRTEVNHTSFDYIGSDITLTSTKVWVSTSVSVPITPFLSFSDCSFYNGNNGAGLFMNLLNTTTVFRNHAFYVDAGLSGALYYTASGTYTQLEDSVFYYTVGLFVSSAYSQGGQGATYRRCKFWSNGATTGSVSITNGAGLEFVDCEWHTNQSTSPFVWLGSGDATFTGCKFGSSDLPGTPTFYYILDAGTTYGQVGTFRLNDCLFGTPTTSFYKNLDKPNLKYVTYVANKNLDPLVQEIYTPNGITIRDNNSIITGVTSLRIAPTSATNAATFTLQIPAPTGNKVGVSGYLRRTVANTTTVTLSGLGITPSTYTASGAVDTNEQFFVSGTQTTGTDGILTLTISTTGTSGYLYVDSVSAPQAAAIDFGEFGYWSGGLPTQLMTATYVSASDVWNTLASNVTVPGSMGKMVKFIKTILLSK